MKTERLQDDIIASGRVDLTVRGSESVIPSSSTSPTVITSALTNEVTLNDVSYKIINRITISGESEIFLVNKQGKDYIFKYYHSQFKPKDEILTKLKGLIHPDIIALIDYGYHQDRFFEISEFARGGTLEEIMPVRSLSKIKEIVAETIEALSYLHTNGIIHRDVKPENIFYRTADKKDIAIGDFGIASNLQEGEELVRTSVARTSLYAAPELFTSIQGKTTIEKSVDYYALGMTILHLWFGSNPFEDVDEFGIMRLKSEGRIMFPDGIDNEVEKLIKGLITVNPRDRWSYDEVKKWIEGENVKVNYRTIHFEYTPYIFGMIAGEQIVVNTPKDLAYYLEKYPDKGEGHLYRNTIAKWVQLVDPGLYNELMDIVEKDYPKDKKAGLTKSIYVLDREKLFTSDGPENIKLRTQEEIAIYFEQNFTYFQTVLENPNAAFYVFLEARDYKNKADQFREFFIQYDHELALNTLIFALQGGDKFIIDNQVIYKPEELIRADSLTKIKIIEQLHNTNSKLSLWISDFGDLQPSIDKWRILKRYDEVTLPYAIGMGFELNGEYAKDEKDFYALFKNNFTKYFSETATIEEQNEADYWLVNCCDYSFSKIVIDYIKNEKYSEKDLTFMVSYFRNIGLIILQNILDFIETRDFNKLIEVSTTHEKTETTQDHLVLKENENENTRSGSGARDALYEDAKYEDAKQLVLRMGMASVSMLERGLSVGYARAGGLIDQLEKDGVIGTHNGSKPREVLTQNDNLDELIKNAFFAVNYLNKDFRHIHLNSETNTVNSILKESINFYQIIFIFWYELLSNIRVKNEGFVSVFSSFLRIANTFCNDIQSLKDEIDNLDYKNFDSSCFTRYRDELLIIKHKDQIFAEKMKKECEDKIAITFDKYEDIKQENKEKYKTLTEYSHKDKFWKSIVFALLLLSVTTVLNFIPHENVFDFNKLIMDSNKLIISHYETINLTRTFLIITAILFLIRALYLYKDRKREIDRIDLDSSQLIALSQSYKQIEVYFNKKELFESTNETLRIFSLKDSELEIEFNNMRAIQDKTEQKPCAGVSNSEYFEEVEDKIVNYKNNLNCRISNFFNKEMVFVKGGTFNMGCNKGEDDEKTVHKVTVGDFYMGKYQVTVAEFREFINATSYKTDAEKCGDTYLGFGLYDRDPVTCVSWNDSVEYCKWLSSITGQNYRLATEAEWEYAAKGGNQSSWYNRYSGSNNVDEVAWYEGNSGDKVHPVGTKDPNKLGIYDMSGNVWEWCSDWYGSYSSGSQDNPTGLSTGSHRVLRGGGWNDSATNCRVADRDGYTPGYSSSSHGFRVVRLP